MPKLCGRPTGCHARSSYPASLAPGASPIWKRQSALKLLRWRVIDAGLSSPGRLAACTDMTVAMPRSAAAGGVNHFLNRFIGLSAADGRTPEESGAANQSVDRFTAQAFLAGFRAPGDRWPIGGYSSDAHRRRPSCCYIRCADPRSGRFCCNPT